MRRNLFWKLALTFFALLLSVLLAVDFFAERALQQRLRARAPSMQLATIARFAQAQPPRLPSSPPHSPEDLRDLRAWVAQMGQSGVRVTVITSDGQVLADSQSDPQHDGESRGPRRKFREALAKGEGDSVRHSVTLNRDLLYYAVKQN